MAKVECLTAEQLAADEGWWRIYAEAFSPESQEPPAVIVSAVRSGVGLAVSLRERGETIGLASLHLLRDPPVVFLVYLAMQAGLRGQGMGGRLLDAAIEQGYRQLREQSPEPLGWVCEIVLSPDAAGDHEGERLLRFYQRHGGELLAQPYIQPPVDGINYVPMRLLFGRAPSATEDTPLEPEALVRAIYHEKYGAVNGIPASALEECIHRAGLAPEPC